MSNEPTKYKTKRWFNIKRRCFCWGIIGLLNGEWVNVTESEKAKFYYNRNQAVKRVKQLNKEVSNG
jgi:hypothetical protein